MEYIQTNNGLTLKAIFVKELDVQTKLFYCQDRLVVTSWNNKEIRSLDVVDFVMINHKF